MNDKKKSPCTAATVAEAKPINHVKNTTNIDAQQELFDLSVNIYTCERLISEIQQNYFESATAPFDFEARYENIQVLLFAAGGYAWKARQIVEALEQAAN